MMQSKYTKKYARTFFSLILLCVLGLTVCAASGMDKEEPAGNQDKQDEEVEIKEPEIGGDHRKILNISSDNKKMYKKPNQVEQPRVRSTQAPRVVNMQTESEGGSYCCCGSTAVIFDLCSTIAKGCGNCLGEWDECMNDGDWGGDGGGGGE
jgi:hypothetical protein